MTASYPNSVKVFPTHVNVTEVIDAGHPNAIQDEVVAIESALGANPALSTTPSSSGTFVSSSTSFSTVSARIANVETGVVADSHTQYLRKAADGSNTIIPNNSTTKGLIVKAVAGQTANLVEFQDANGNVVGYVDANGLINGTANTGGGDGSNSFSMMIMGA
jgi:hypothetical protein